MRFLGMGFIGLIVGVLARFVYPGDVPMNWLASALLGVGGSFFAGFVGNFIHKQPASEEFHKAGFGYSIVGAMVLIFLARNVLHLV